MANSADENVPDPEKKKYFKVQANHTAPLGYKYTKDDIKNRKETSLKRKRWEEHNQRLSTEKIKRSNILRHTISGTLLQQESGTLLTSRSLVFEQREATCARLFSRNCLVDLASSDVKYPVSRFARDPWSGNLLVAINTASCFNLLVSSNGQTGETVHISMSRLFNPSDPQPVTQYVVDAATTFCYPGSIVWCSAACPSSTESIFAAGKSNELLLVTGIESSWNIRSFKMSPCADVMAVEWLAPQVVMTGLKNSLVRLYDLRSRDTASRLQHPHGVYKIRKVDDWRIVVAGAQKNLHMYDLRFTPNTISEYPQPNKPTHTWTKPYLSFPDYANDLISHDELDISAELGLLACGSQSNRIQLFSLSTGKLVMPPPLFPSSLSSIPTPQQVPTSSSIPNHSQGVTESGNSACKDVPMTHIQYANRIRCLRFENLDAFPTVNGGISAGTPSLLVSAGSTVEEWRM
ncbi:uncharacterized protein PADG_08384 [Paracoccidioides brasiliensis Pb18]|uniref:Uncharacterized protein n=1 Tax=Paracoccidioides brasiliensis (strain Pb18) TaxID=502780 RepID=C1GLZ3_PARBD|nr:uncharacterized protein PADG_08384 [Paracoccidioides brasiliensis Pb18]EEH43459.2 hypothetical protein PADG_08384 [Paracoccidioides brasiliensis Pb18]